MSETHTEGDMSVLSKLFLLAVLSLFVVGAFLTGYTFGHRDGRGVPCQPSKCESKCKDCH
jgi:hypothetical protein